MLVFISRATRLPVFDKSYTTLFVKLLSKKMVAAKKIDWRYFAMFVNKTFIYVNLYLMATS